MYTIVLRRRICCHCHALPGIHFLVGRVTEYELNLFTEKKRRKKEALDQFEPILKYKNQHVVELIGFM